MKKLIKLIALLVILSVLVAGYFVFNSYMEKKENEKNADASENAVVEVLSLDADVINSIEYDYVDEKISLKKEGNEWKWTEDSEYPLDQTYPEDMVSVLSAITADRIVAESLDNEADFGMDEPNVTVKFTTTGDKEYVYTIGSYNSTAKGYYIKISGKDKIYITKNSVTDSFVFGVLDMAKPETLDTTTAEMITSVEYTSADKKITLTTDSTGADFYTAPYSYFYVGKEGVKVAADGQAAGEMMSAAAAATIEYVKYYKPDEETLKRCGFGENKTGVLKVTYNEEVKSDGSDTSVSVTKSNSYTINVAVGTDEEGKTAYYAMLDGSNFVFGLNGGSDFFSAIEADFESKLICPMSADDTVSFKIEMGSEVYFYNIADIENNEKLIGVFNSITSIVSEGNAQGEKGELLMKTTFDMNGTELVLNIYKFDETNYIASFDKKDGILVSAEKIDSIINKLKD